MKNKNHKVIILMKYNVKMTQVLRIASHCHSMQTSLKFQFIHEVELLRLWNECVVIFSRESSYVFQVQNQLFQNNKQNKW